MTFKLSCMQETVYAKIIRKSIRLPQPLTIKNIETGEGGKSDFQN